MALDNCSSITKYKRISIIRPVNGIGYLLKYRKMQANINRPTNQWYWIVAQANVAGRNFRGQGKYSEWVRSATCCTGTSEASARGEAKARAQQEDW